MVELIKLLVPRISTTLLRQPLVRNVSTNAPHEYSYQFELCALLNWAFTKPLYDTDIRVIPEAKELDANRGRIDIVVFNHGVYAIELGANMDKAKYECGLLYALLLNVPLRYDEHYVRTCHYVEFLRKMYPEKVHATGYVVNFTTKKEQCDYFPERTNASISLLNVYVCLDDPDKNFYYVYEPRELEQGMASLSLGHSKPAAKQARSTPLKAKLGMKGTNRSITIAH